VRDIGSCLGFAIIQRLRFDGRGIAASK